MGISMTSVAPLSAVDPKFMASEHRWVVRLLGGFQFWWKGSLQVGIPRASQRLLAFLALNGGVVSRATVSGTLWPDATERHAYANLRSALARLGRICRQALHANKLELGLAEGVMVDLRQAQMLARRLLDPAATHVGPELGTAAAVTLSADLLPGWYDEWALTDAEEWRLLRLHALEALARWLTAAGRWGEAAAAAAAAVRAEPLRQSAHDALIQVHLAEGNQSEAVREFERYRTLLNAELGLEPTQRLHRLIQDVQNR